MEVFGQDNRAAALATRTSASRAQCSAPERRKRGREVEAEQARQTRAPGDSPSKRPRRGGLDDISNSLTGAGGGPCKPVPPAGVVPVYGKASGAEGVDTVLVSANCRSARASGEETQEEPSTPCRAPLDEELLEALVCLKRVEARRAVSFRTLAKLQPDCTETNRALLVDWLVEVHEELGYKPETLASALELFDRYCCLEAVPLARIQLLGITCLHIAAKLEEVAIHSLNLLCQYTQNTYTPAEAKALEARVLTALDFRVVTATPLAFLQLYEKMIGLDHPASECDNAASCGQPPASASVQHVARWLCELAAQSHKTAAITPSRLAAAALNLASLVVHRRWAWDGPAAAASGVPSSSLPAVMDLLFRAHASAEVQAPGICDKYASTRHGSVSVAYSAARVRGGSRRET